MMFWIKKEPDLTKAKEDDREKYGHEGFLSHFGYVPFRYCTDIVKLHKVGNSPAKLSFEFSLNVVDVMTILAKWACFVTSDSVENIYSLGGTEYTESQQLKNAPPLNKEDLDNLLIDLHLFSKSEKPENSKKDKQL
jgi:hypothetical protein